MGIVVHLRSSLGVQLRMETTGQEAECACRTWVTVETRPCLVDTVSRLVCGSAAAAEESSVPGMPANQTCRASGSGFPRQYSLWERSTGQLVSKRFPDGGSDSAGSGHGRRARVSPRLVSAPSTPTAMSSDMAAAAHGRTRIGGQRGRGRPRGPRRGDAVGSETVQPQGRRGLRACRLEA